MRYHSYLNSAKKIIESNWGDVPFAIFLKKYFAANKKYGGKDRKQIAALCYDFYRLGKALPNMPVSEKIIVAVFLCEHDHSDFLEFHKPEWNQMITTPIDEKLKLLGFTAHDVFPWADELSAGIEFQPFCHSFFVQPDLFLRVRPGKQETVVNKVREAGLRFEQPHDDCIALPNATKVDAILEIDREVVIQDLNSQQVLDILKEGDLKKPVTVWDCCAASGGKSILAYDILNARLELTVSDIRESILQNLNERFARAGIINYASFVADLTKNNDKLPLHKTQLIICDAPCTGSGTWSRTPEQMFFFKQPAIDVYAEMQKKIVARVIPQLQKGGILIYITCSVFKKENEEIVDLIKERSQLQLLKMGSLKGYDIKADSMFVAVFQKQ